MIDRTLWILNTYYRHYTKLHERKHTLKSKKAKLYQHVEDTEEKYDARKIISWPALLIDSLWSEAFALPA